MHLKLFGKSERKGPHGRARHSSEDIIEMDLKELGYDGVDWIHLSYITIQWWVLMTTVMNILVP
jgi:hypothetical protein